MTRYESVEQVFQSLGSRLFELETERYIYANAPIDIGPCFQKEFPYHDIMNEIGKEINTHDTTKVVHVASLYEKRVRNILKKLEAEKNIEYLITELNVYLTDLVIIQKTLVPLLPKSTTENTITVKEILLSPDFAIDEMTPYFKPLVSTRQAAYLLQYFEQVHLIPNYNVETMKKLAEVIFVRNGKNVTDEKRLSGYQKKKKDLDPLKSLLESLLALVEKDLKSAK